MSLRNSNQEYGSLAKTAHWVGFFLIAAMLSLGLWFEDMPKGDEKRQWMELHISLGLVLLSLMLLRLGWRWAQTGPADPPSVPAWQNTLARWTHRALYLLIFLQMSTGIMTRLTVASLPFFGLFEIPTPFAENRDLHGQFEDLHKLGWIPLVSLIGVHVVAALYHQFVRKDGVLRRMLRLPGQ